MASKVRYAAAIGLGEFPWDMLRYDFCTPATEHDSGLLVYRDEEFVRMIVLKRWDVAGRWTPDRWNSFRWSLIVGTGGLGGGFATEEEARRMGQQCLVSIHKP